MPIGRNNNTSLGFLILESTILGVFLFPSNPKKLHQIRSNHLARAKNHPRPPDRVEEILVEQRGGSHYTLLFPVDCNRDPSQDVGLFTFLH